MTSAAAAKAYFSAADYYATCPGEWLGKGAAMLGLTGVTNQMHFWSLADNLHPQTGEPLTTYTRDGRRVGLDMTFNAVKSVSLAREMAGPDNAGDPRIESAHREAVAYTVGLIEQDMQARVRAGGKDENRTTGNLVAYRVTHRDTRINADDQMPDPNLHDHVFFFNATYDPVERKWKAAEIGQIKHDAPYYEAVYHNRLAGNLQDLGFGVERKGKSFELAGVSRDTVDKFSRRSRYINEVASKLGIVKPESKAKLGATTRLGKVEQQADNLNGYYVSRLTGAEKEALANLQGKPSREVSVEAAVGYAISHMFERQSVVDAKRLFETALRYGIGSVTLEGVQKEAKRQGLLVKNGAATTKAVLAEEQKVIAFARDGQGTCRPMGMVAGPVGVRTTPAIGFTLDERIKQTDRATPGAINQQQKGRPDESKRPVGGGVESVQSTLLERVRGIAPLTQAGTFVLPHPPRDLHPATPSPEPQAEFATDINVTSKLSPEQAAMVNHLLTSPDRVMLVIGDAGTGKTFAVKSAFQHINRPVDIIAPGAQASRGVLRHEGFATADTVTAFLASQKRQDGVKNGVIWVDEAGQLPMRDLSALVDVAKAQNARLILQGDPKQHRAVARDGNMVRVLESHAGLPVARLQNIRRQRGQFKEAVASLAAGQVADGFDRLVELGWVQQTPVTDHNRPLVNDYLAALDARKEVLAIAPTHAEANEVTAAIRNGLKARGVLGEEREVKTLVPLHWSEAERGDLERYTGGEVIQFYRNGGTFKAGDRVALAEFKKGQRLGAPSTFGVFGTAVIPLAAGDRIRVTNNGWTADRKHRLDNGAQYTVAGFAKDGGIRLTNGWTVSPEFKHFTHGYVTTSHASQGRTVDRVLIAMGGESLGAIRREQLYVSVSRGREQAKIYTDLAPAALREAIARADDRKAATEVFNTPHRRNRVYVMLKRAREAFAALRTRGSAVKPERINQRERVNGR